MFAANAERKLFASLFQRIPTDFSDIFSLQFLFTSLYRKSVRHLQSLQPLRPASTGLIFLDVDMGSWNWSQHKTLHS